MTRFFVPRIVLKRCINEWEFVSGSRISISFPVITYRPSNPPAENDDDDDDDDEFESGAVIDGWIIGVKNKSQQVCK